MKLSIIIPSLNDYSETQATIASIHETAGDKPEIIVIDDASQVPLTLVDKSAILIRNNERAGVAASRHIGALNATGEVLLLLDSHCRFEAGWYETAIARCKDRPFTIHQPICVQLTLSQMDMTKARGTYTGARICFHEPDMNDGGKLQTLEGKWAVDRQGEDDYQLGCIMGGAYLVPNDFYHHVGGLKLLKGWGLDEPFLSLKWYLAGGDIRMMKDIRIGHQFRSATNYKTDAWMPAWNKLAMCHTVLPEDRARKLISLFPNTQDLTTAKRQVDAEWNTLLSERAYNQAVQKRSFEWYLSQFGVSCP